MGSSERLGPKLNRKVKVSRVSGFRFSDLGFESLCSAFGVVGVLGFKVPSAELWLLNF